MRHLITGGAGFIGSHLCEQLIAGGDDVLVLDDLSTGRYENVAALDGGDVLITPGPPVVKYEHVE